MTPVSADLRAEVLERLSELGAGRSWTASHVARCGEQRSTAAVWTALRDLADVGQVVCNDEDEGRFRLPPAPHEASELTHDQMTIGDS